jgi:AcrR family transcriptional regulator
MKDIADVVGVSAPALYRHFTGKQQLLAAAISTGLTAAENAACRARADGLGAVIASLAETAVDDQNLWMLLHRESRHLYHGDREALAERFAALIDVVGAAVGDEHPDLEVASTHFLSQAMLAALSAPSQYGQTLTGKALGSALAAAAMRVLEFRDASLSSRQSLSRPPFDPSLHRREGILQAAASLFAERGYEAVTLADIGSAVAIAGPSIYNHFEGKADVLAGVLWRSVDWIESDMTWAIAGNDEPEDALRQLYGDYTAIAVRHRELFRVFTVEGVHLPNDERNRIGRAHRHFVDRWVALLRSARPDLSLGMARADVTASLCVINDLGHRPPFRDSPDAGHLLTAMAIAIAEL